MNDPERVRLVERPCRLRQEIEHLGAAEPPPLLHHLLEIVAVEQLHHEERRAVELGGDVGVDHFHDVVALDARRSPRLALEALDGLRIFRRPSVKKLQREEIAGARVLDDVHDAHPPATELADDAVARRDERGRGVGHGATEQFMGIHDTASCPLAPTAQLLLAMIAMPAEFEP